MALAAGKLWCAIRDRIFVVCPNSLKVQVALSSLSSRVGHRWSSDHLSAFILGRRLSPACLGHEHRWIVDASCLDCISRFTRDPSLSRHTLQLSSRDKHSHSRDTKTARSVHRTCSLVFTLSIDLTRCLFVCSVCDDIIRAHKLGCLRVTALHICKETLWVGTSAGVLVNITVPQIIDSSSSSSSSNGTNRFPATSLQLKGLSCGHAGPVRSIISTDTTVVTPTEDAPTVKTIILTVGDGFEDYANNDETLGKDDSLSHVIVWQL